MEGLRSVQVLQASLLGGILYVTTLYVLAETIRGPSCQYHPCDDSTLTFSLLTVLYNY
jgi:hypothetical protein